MFLRFAIHKWICHRSTGVPMYQGPALVRSWARSLSNASHFWNFWRRPKVPSGNEPGDDSHQGFTAVDGGFFDANKRL